MLARVVKNTLRVLPMLNALSAIEILNKSQMVRGVVLSHRDFTSTPIHQLERIASPIEWCKS